MSQFFPHSDLNSVFLGACMHPFQGQQDPTLKHPGFLWKTGEVGKFSFTSEFTH